MSTIEHENSSQNRRITWEGCSVLLDINDGDRLLFSRLTAGSIVKIGNKNYPLQPLIGCPFGSLFQVENGINGPCLSRVIPTPEANNNTEDKREGAVKDESRDNRALIDNNTAQTLTGEDIEGLRRQGASGNEIVEALIANSATFENKTAFSQEKYRLKKQKSTLLKYSYDAPSPAAYVTLTSRSILQESVDTLSLLLSFANVTAQSDVLVVDMIGGLITGAVAERLGGTGYVCNTYRGDSPHSLEIVRMFNFGDEINRRIVRLPLTELSASHVGDSKGNGHLQVADSIENPSNQSDVTLSSIQSDQPVSMEATTVASEDEKPDTVTVVAKVHKAVQPGEKAPEDAIKSWKENGFSSLIIAAPDADAWNIVKEVLPFLSFSAPFVIYHQYLQPLATCMHNLQVEKMAIGLQITEPWLREYQVLPSRTHPHMQMSASGGYVLSGTKIYNEDQPNK
uniref:tRNA (adenine(58)-N(1))-methyltransferase non-catalytic subunit TRM6 n=1 Tax=Helianthus annuus TaxID=4232 RepID=A0A251SDV7_HELAN